MNDDSLSQEDLFRYIDLPPDLDLSAQSASLLPAPPSLLHSARTATPDANMLSTQTSEQDLSTQSTSYVSNATDVNDSLPESFLDYLFLSSPLVLPPYLHSV